MAFFHSKAWTFNLAEGSWNKFNRAHRINMNHKSIDSNSLFDCIPVRMIAMITLAMALLFACGMGQKGSAPPPELRVEALSAGTQGGGSNPEPSAERITSREELKTVLDARIGNQIPVQNLTKDLEIDFSTSWVLLVRMGQKPTAGYSLKLDPASCSISQQTAHVSLLWAEPDPGMVTAQVITSPFILLAISKGGYNSVEVVDQQGQIRLGISIDK